jgi:methylenetetrahydrofolate dehydrogenase (NADP+) / methenyltetrahydrofolate cyclohydrolase
MMVATILNGKQVSAEIRATLTEDVKVLAKEGIKPGLTVILVGEDPASKVYVGSKDRACQEIGIRSEIIRLPESTPEAEVLAHIERLNNDKNIHGILVQLPLPKQIDEMKVMMAISPEKDVDGFHPINVGKLMTGDFTPFLPCTPAGIIELIKRSGLDLSGKHAVVIGRSNIVGKPISLLLLRENLTVTITHSRTQDLPGVCRQADVLVAAIGKPEFVTADFVKKGAVIIDVGVNRVEKGLVGDVAFDEVSPLASAITPVPGGVGPMTIAMLMRNCVAGAKAFGTVNV